MGLRPGWVRVGFGVLGKGDLLMEVGIFKTVSGYSIALQASQPQPLYKGLRRCFYMMFEALWE